MSDLDTIIRRHALVACGFSNEEDFLYWGKGKDIKLVDDMEKNIRNAVKATTPVILAESPYVKHIEDIVIKLANDLENTIEHLESIVEKNVEGK